MKKALAITAAALMLSACGADIETKNNDISSVTTDEQTTAGEDRSGKIIVEEKEKPAETTKATEKPAETTKPSESVKETEPSKESEPVNTTKSEQPEETTGTAPTESGETAGTTNPAEPTESTEPPRSSVILR